MEKLSLDLYAFLKKGDKLVGVRFADEAGDFVDMTVSQFAFCIDRSTPNLALNEEKILNGLKAGGIGIDLDYDIDSLCEHMVSYDGRPYKTIQVDDALFDTSIAPEHYLSVIYPNGIVRMKSPRFVDVSKYIDTFNRFVYGTNIIDDFNVNDIYAHWCLDGIRVKFSTEYPQEILDEVTMQFGNWLSQYGLSYSKKIVCDDSNMRYISIIVYIDSDFVENVKNLPEYHDPKVEGYCYDVINGVFGEDVYYKFVKTELGRVITGRADITSPFKYDTTESLGEITEDELKFNYSGCYTQFKIAPYPNSVYINFYKHLTYSSNNIRLEHDVIGMMIDKSEVLSEIVRNIYPVNGQKRFETGYLSYCYMQCDIYGGTPDEIAKIIENELNKEMFNAETMLNTREYSLEGFYVKAKSESIISVGVFMCGLSSNIMDSMKLDLIQDEAYNNYYDCTDSEIIYHKR